MQHLPSARVRLLMECFLFDRKLRCNSYQIKNPFRNITIFRKGRIYSRFHPSCKAYCPASFPRMITVSTGPDWGHSEVVFTGFDMRMFPAAHPSLAFAACYSSRLRVGFFDILWLRNVVRKLTSFERKSSLVGCGT